MFMRQLTLIFLILCALTLRAERTLLATSPADVAAWDIHARSGTNTWQIIWNYLDDDNYCAAQVLKESHIDDYLGWRSTFRFVSKTKGVERLVAQRSFDTLIRQFSLRLVGDEFAAHLYLADGEELEGVSGLLDIRPRTKIFFEDDGLLGPTVLTVGIDSLNPPRMSSPADFAALAAQIMASTDPLEGIWQYLDRDFAGNEIALGGSYTIAIVRAPSSADRSESYEIIYLGGARTHSTLWQPLHLKGSLSATTFVDLYDLRWLDSKRHVLGAESEVNARRDGGVLQFNFPLVGSSMRFALQPKSRTAEILAGLKQ